MVDQLDVNLCQYNKDASSLSACQISATTRQKELGSN